MVAGFPSRQQTWPTPESRLLDSSPVVLRGGWAFQSARFQSVSEAEDGRFRRSLGGRCLCRGQRVLSGPPVDTPGGASSNTKNRQSKHPEGRDPRRRKPGDAC